MEKLLTLLKTSAWQEMLAITDVWATRFMLLAAILLVGGVAIQTPTAGDTLQAGLAAQSQQEYWRAEAFFQQATLIAPNDAQPWLDLARLHLLEHQDDLAQNELETADNLAPGSADIWLTLGDVAHDQGHLQDAEDAWLRATHLTPAAAQMQAHERLGIFYEEQGRWQQAEAQFAALPASDTLAQYHLGALLLERGDRAAARQAFEAALNQTTNNDQHDAAQRFLQVLDQWNGSAQSQELLGFTYIQNALPALAIAPLQQAIALAPQDATAHAYLGWAYLQTGSASQAQQEENRAVKLDPGASFANYVLSLLALAGGNYASASHDLDVALSRDPQNPVLWATRGQIAEQLNDLPTAENNLIQAVKHAGDDPQFSLLLATFYANHQIGLEDGTALSAAQTAVALNPASGLAYDALGLIQQDLRNFPAAMNAFLEAVNLAPTNATLHLHLGNTLAILGYLRSAELNLHKAMVLDFNGPIAKQARLLLQTLPPLDV